MVTSVSSTTSAASTASQGATFDAEQFLGLLLLQLKNQDPTSAMDQSEFAAQLAMLFEVSAVQDVSDRVAAGSSQMGLLTASSLLGRTVSLDDSGSTVSGAVEAVTIDSNGQIQLQVDGTSYSIDDLTEVS